MRRNPSQSIQNPHSHDEANLQIQWPAEVLPDPDDCEAVSKRKWETRLWEAKEKLRKAAQAKFQLALVSVNM